MNTAHKKILLTGGAGYIGSKLANQLLQAGDCVIIVDDLSTGVKENIPSGAVFYQTDINSPTFMDIVSQESPDCIVHMAASKSVNESMNNPDKFKRINVEGSKKVIDAAIANHVGTFVFTSTAGVYGDVIASYAQKESDEPNPSSVYAQTKLEIEKYILAMNAKGFNGHIVRFANVYGIGGNADLKGAVNVFIEKILARDPIEIHGDGKQTRDFVHIDDLLSVCRILIHTPPDTGEETPIYNVSTGIDISINDLVDLIGELSGESIQKRYLPETFIGQKSSRLSTEKAKTLLHWSSQISLRAGVDGMIQSIRKSL